MATAGGESGGGTMASRSAMEAANDWRDVLAGADFVVLSFARQTVKYRGIDCNTLGKVWHSHVFGRHDRAGRYLSRDARVPSTSCSCAQ
jgi:hypothetical protein